MKNYKFHNLLIIPTKQLNNLIKIESEALSNQWKIILMNDGSFTQNLNSLTGRHIQPRPLYKTFDILLNKKKVQSYLA